MSLYDSLNDSVLDTFGEPVVFFTTGAGPVTVVCVVERPAPPIASVGIAAEALGAPVLGPGDLLVTALTAEVAAAGLAARDTAVIDGHTYTLNVLWPDNGGMTALELRA